MGSFVSVSHSQQQGSVHVQLGDSTLQVRGKHLSPRQRNIPTSTHSAAASASKGHGQVKIAGPPANTADTNNHNYEPRNNHNSLHGRVCTVDEGTQTDETRILEGEMIVMRYQIRLLFYCSVVL